VERLGLRRQDRRAGQRADGRAHHAAAGFDARISRLTPERVAEIARRGKTVRLISRARRIGGRVSLRVRAEVLDRCDILAATPGTFEPDPVPHRPDGHLRHGLIEPTVEQTAYGVFSDLVNLTRVSG